LSETKCPNCGTNVKQGNYCTNCGYSLQENTSKFDEATSEITRGTASMVQGMEKLAAALGEYTDQKIRSVTQRKEVSDVLSRVDETMKRASDEIDRAAKKVQDRIDERRPRRAKKGSA